MSTYPNDWAVVIPLANEENEIPPLVCELEKVMDRLEGGTVYFIVDTVSKDNTYEVCQEISAKDARFISCWMPKNKNVVDAYFNGFRRALEGPHEIIIEMDGGLSHDPRAIPAFLRALHEGNDCAFGSRYINGGSMVGSPLKRRVISKIGTVLAQLLLGAGLADMTSGYQAFRRDILSKLVEFELRSKAHFYQTEVRHLLRHHKIIEVPIHYRAPSPSVSSGAIRNSVSTLLHYTTLRVCGKSPSC